MKIVDIRVRPKMVVRIKDNCGNGAGGFQAGNDCASGGGGGRERAGIDVADERVRETMAGQSVRVQNPTNQDGLSRAYPGIGENVELNTGISYESEAYSAKEFAENLADDAGSIGVVRSQGRGYGNLYTFKIGDQMMGAAELAQPGRQNRTFIFADEQGAIADDS